MNWAAQKRALVSLPKNCGTDPGWYDQSLFTDTEYTGLLPVSLRMDPELLTFVINFCLLSVPNIHCEQRGTSSFIVTNISGKTPSFSSLNMDLGFRWYNFSCKHFNSCYKDYSNSGNIILSICSCAILLDSLM